MGTYSFFAAQSGARRVYAIERERVIEVAEELAARNGLAERIAFIRADSTETTLPEQADVLILEDFSSLFLRRGLEELVRDALDRHLKGGWHHRAARRVAVCGTRWRCFALEQRAESRGRRYQLYGLDLSVLREMMLASPHVRKIEPEALLAEPTAFKTIVLKQPQSYLFDEVLAVVIARSGTMYGLGGWFDLTLTESIRLSNAPGSDSVWRAGLISRSRVRWRSPQGKSSNSDCRAPGARKPATSGGRGRDQPRPAPRTTARFRASRFVPVRRIRRLLPDRTGASGRRIALVPPTCSILAKAAMNAANRSASECSSLNGPIRDGVSPLHQHRRREDDGRSRALRRRVMLICGGLRGRPRLRTHDSASSGGRAVQSRELGPMSV